MKFKIKFLLAVLLSGVLTQAAHATDIYTWKPGYFKINAGGAREYLTVLKQGRFYPISTLGQNTDYIFPDPGKSSCTIAVAPIESSQIGIDVIQHVTVPLTSANILAMYATPVQLIAAGATGTNIVVHKVMFTMIPSGTAYTGGTSVEFQIGNTAHGAGTLTTGALANTVVDASGTTTTYNTLIPVAYAGTAATGLYISVTGSTFATGTGTALVDVWYSEE